MARPLRQIMIALFAIACGYFGFSMLLAAVDGWNSGQIVYRQRFSSITRLITRSESPVEFSLRYAFGGSFCVMLMAVPIVPTIAFVMQKFELNASDPGTGAFKKIVVYILAFASVVPAVVATAIWLCLLIILPFF